MTDQPEDQPKIIVDTDWKAKVAAEKEELRQREAAAQTSSAEAPAEAASPASADEEALPPASFSFLVTSLATQAMVALGQIPDPFENKPVVRMTLARHHIDLLGVLEEKTRGNLTPEEASLLSHVLADLRMAYVAMENHLRAKRS